MESTNLITVQKEKMVEVLPENQWDTTATLEALENLTSSLKASLLVIAVDNRELQPPVYRVLEDVFFKKTKISLSQELEKKLNEFEVNLELGFNQKLIDGVRKSQIDKQKGRVRKYDDVARELGLEV